MKIDDKTYTELTAEKNVAAKMLAMSAESLLRYPDNPYIRERVAEDLQSYKDAEAKLDDYRSQRIDIHGV